MSGQARAAACKVAGIALIAANRRATARGSPQEVRGRSFDGDNPIVADLSGTSTRLSRGNALASRLASSGDDQLPHLRPAVRKVEEDMGRAPSDEFGVDLAIGESVEVIRVRFLHFTRFAELDIGEKYIGPSAFAPWSEMDETRLSEIVEKYDFGGGACDWRVVEVAICIEIHDFELNLK